MSALIPVHIITGFLGSGKTTLLNDVLRDGAFAQTAVIVNEIGAIGLDHLIIEQVNEGVILLSSGCICCTIRTDLRDAIHSLLNQVRSGQLPAFDRLIIETTGLAEPEPIVSTLLAEPMIRHQYELGNIVCTVDGIAGLDSLAQFAECGRQIAVADRIVVTKSDLASRDALNKLESRLAAINPTAQFSRGHGHAFDASLLFERSLSNERMRSKEVEKWLESCLDIENRQSFATSAHINEIETFSTSFNKPLNWVALGIWLSALLHAHGANILRVKALLHLEGASAPVMLHGVQHVVHPPMHLAAWDRADRKSYIVFITRGCSGRDIQQSLETFLGRQSSRSAFAEPEQTRFTPGDLQ